MLKIITPIIITLQLFTAVYGNELCWPKADNTSKPWARWWWMGNAVDKEGIEHQLNQLADGGIGGVEICPIYGVKGYESRSLIYLSPKWLEMYTLAINTARQKGMDLDLTCGTGWPFGGGSIDKDTASTGLIIEKVDTTAGESISRKLKGDIQYAIAISTEGEKVALSDCYYGNGFKWQAPSSGSWTVYIAAAKCPMQRVKRAAPGSEGYVVNPYSINALDHYLADFDKALARADIPKPRCFFHDSFEYYGADWSGDFFDQFKKLRGYDLRNYLEILAGDGDRKQAAAICYDYRKTVSDLHIQWLKHWDKWCNLQGSLSRNQAHGAPANLLDLYGASDIPETEIFRKVEDKQIPMLKFASSAAHLNGGKLASAEAFTWLSEHFQSPLSKLKDATDFLLISGINHVLFHGIPYSPAEAKWPGWQFYASVNFSPLGGLWHDLPAYNAYVSRCQSVMQDGTPDEDILLYIPMADIWQKETDKLFMTFTVHNDWMAETSLFDTAEKLLKHGLAFDYISDDYLQKLIPDNGKYKINNKAYSVIIVPATHYMPLETLEQLNQLAAEGCRIVFEGELPSEMPGMMITERDKQIFSSLLSKISTCNTITINSKIDTLDIIAREKCVEYGIDFNRRKTDYGYCYFLANRSNEDFSGWLETGRCASSYILMDPLFESKMGIAKSRTIKDKSQVYLQLKSGGSIVVKTLNKTISGQPWHYTGKQINSTELTGSWQVDFINGGPTIPDSFTSEHAQLWTNRGDTHADNFSGTASYKLIFNLDNINKDKYILNLGKVNNSARIIVNGNYAGNIWSEPFVIEIGEYLIAGKNELEVQVTNLAANRIRYMDINKINWKYFYDINVVNIDYKPFDASNWAVQDSGLDGPVTLSTYSIFE